MQKYGPDTILITNDAMAVPSLLRVPKQHWLERRQTVCSVFLKLQCLANISKLIMILTQFICVQISNWSKNKPFVTIGRLNRQFPQRLPCISASLSVGATDGKSEISTICQGSKKHIMLYLWFVFSVKYWYIRYMTFGVIWSSTFCQFFTTL